MSELATLARPYATAAFKRAKETASTTKWSDSLAFMVAVMTDQQIVSVASNPRVNKDRLAQLLLTICNEQIDSESTNFLKLLLQNGRLGLLPDIANQFEAIKAEDEGYIDVEVTTAYAFTKEANNNFSATLEKFLNKKIHMNVTLDKSLIGGVIVRAGDRVIDGSIKGQLQQLQKALM
jgi:F-type H+-transporting ATPase subunit delta